MDLNKSVSLGVIFGLALFALYLLFPPNFPNAANQFSSQWSFMHTTDKTLLSSPSLRQETNVVAAASSSSSNLPSQSERSNIATSHDFAITAENHHDSVNSKTLDVSLTLLN
jgi:hypothetical protein